MKLKDIKWLMVEKLPLDKYGYSDDDEVAKHCAEHGNAIIDLQGERSLNLNREKLAKVMYLEMNREGNWDELSELVKHVFLARADAVKAALPEILEVTHE